MERAGDQIGEYVESQRNLFIVENAPSPSDGDSNVAPSDALDGAENADLDASTADADFDSPSLADDRRDDDVDEFFDPADDVFFAQKPFYRYDRSNATQEEFAFDPTARSSTTLRDHLLKIAVTEILADN